MNKNNFTLLLKNAGYKVTKPRLFVLSFLSQSKNPVSAKEIATQAKKLHIDQATIYRTLESFKEAEIINEINLQEGRAYFEMKDASDHHHIICIQCKKIKDFTGCESKKLAEKIIKHNRDFASITNHSFEFFGVCKSCA